MSKLTVHRRLHLDTDGATFTTPFVRCPTDRKWASVDTCRHCADGVSVDGTAGEAIVRCAKEPSFDGDPARTPIAEAMEPELLTVGANVTAADVTLALEDRRLAVAVVVDPEGRPIGVCSRADLARAKKGVSAHAIMTPFVITLLASAKVSDALDTILERGVHHIPVLAEGRVIGIVSSTSALRWATQNLRTTRRPRAPLATIP